MKKFILFIVFVFFLFSFLVSCSTGSSMYGITFQNCSDKDVTVKLGDYYIFALKGATVTYYYSITNDQALISFQGVSVEKSYYRPSNTSDPDYGKEVRGISLELGYQYTVYLSLNSGKYYWGISWGNTSARSNLVF